MRPAVPVQWQSAKPSTHPAERAVVAILACVAIIGAMRLANPHVIGHDDGIYAALGASIARTGEYRLINLPSQPPETKYPPLYPSLLALVWAAVPSAKANILALKAVNAALLGVLSWLYWLLLRRQPHLTPVDRILSVTVFISLPGIFSFTDLLVSEPAFLTVLLLLLLAVPARDTSPAPGRFVVIGVVAGAAVLTRTVGAALVAAAVWHVWRTAGVRRAAMVFAAAGIVVAPWLLWRIAVFDSAAGPLERYYIAYETSAWEWVARDPFFASRMIATNAAEYLRGIPVVFGLYSPLLLVGATIVCIAGAWEYPHQERALCARTALCYCLLVIAHPLPMERYLVPLVPLAALLLTAGSAAIRSTLGRWRTASDLAAIAPLAVLLAGNLAWLHHCASTRDEGPQWHFGRRAAFSWSGFEEVFSWLNAHTSPTAVIASAFDPVYFIHTGRRAVRPWVHQPELYLEGYRAPALPDSSSAVVRAALDALGVEFLIVDPIEGGGEGEHARSTLRELLQDSSRWRLAFRSTDGAHRVYRRVYTSLPVQASPL